MEKNTKLKETFHSSFYIRYHKTSILLFLLLTIIPNIISILLCHEPDHVILKVITIQVFVIVFFMINKFESIGINIANRINVFLMFLISTWLGISVLSPADYSEHTNIFLISISVLYCTYSLSSMRIHIVYSLYSVFAISMGFYIKYKDINEVLPYTIILSIFLALTAILLKIRISISNDSFDIMKSYEEIANRLEESSNKIKTNEQLLENVFLSSPFQIAIINPENNTYIKANDLCFPNNELLHYMTGKEYGKTDIDYCEFMQLPNSIAFERLKTIEDVIYTKDRKTLIEIINFKNKEVSTYERVYTPIIKDGIIKYIIMTAKDITDDLDLNNTLINKEIDPLTNTYTRKYVEGFIKNKIRQNSPVGRPLLVGIFYISNMSMINQKYGYEGGDRVLKIIGEFLTEAMGLQNNCVGKLPSNEFLVCVDFIETDDEVIDWYDNILKKFNKIRNPYKKDGIEMCLSCGVSLYKRHSTEQYLLIKYAEEALSEIKRKDGVVIYTAKVE